MSEVDIHGGSGNDLIHGIQTFASGYQDIEGGTGDDTLYDEANDTLVGGCFSNTDDATDFLVTAIDGRAGNDIIYGDDQSIPSSLPVVAAMTDHRPNSGRRAPQWARQRRLPIRRILGIRQHFEESGIDCIDFSVSINLTFVESIRSTRRSTQQCRFRHQSKSSVMGGGGDDTFSFGLARLFGNGMSSMAAAA
ncbi:MAG: hypothetical protein U1D30_18825 [Planctomycetota bacterium]